MDVAETVNATGAGWAQWVAVLFLLMNFLGWGISIGVHVSKMNHLTKKIDELKAAFREHEKEFHDHVQDRELHPDPQRLKRLERSINGLIQEE